MKIRGKIIGALYGFAIGDSMGATTEFMTSEQIKKQYGQVDDLIGGGWLNTKPGEVTDDTQMMICVIDALMSVAKIKDNMKAINQKEFQKECMSNFVKWYLTKPKDVGGQCSKAINYYMMTRQYIYSEINSCGNGSLMRALPCALLGSTDLNIMQGILTHNNSTCSQTIAKYTQLIQNCLSGNYQARQYSNLKPTGYVVDTFECVLKHFTNANDFEDGIISAVNEGGDADTIAAIAGGALGAKFGFEYIPSRWIDKLDSNVKQKLDKFAEFIMR